MQYRVIIPKKVQKDLNRVDQKFKSKILSTLAILANNPFIGKKLKGKHKEKWSYQIWPYRIIYKIYQKELTVLLIRIGHRQGVYK